MTHLSGDEIVDALDRTLGAERRAHLDECAECARQVEALSIAWRRAADVDVPEPSPLFWDRFSDRVRAAVAAEPDRPRRWLGWLAWPVLAPLGALAVLVVALVWSVPRPPLVEAPATPAADSTAGGVTLSDEGWAIVSEMVGEIDWETAGEAGLAVAPGDAERVALDLSVEEQRELRRLLAAELDRAKS